jgi:hypothetical protein
MEVIIRIALMFFFIQFLVVMTIMTVAILSARPAVPVLGREPGQEAVRRSLQFVTRLPNRVLRSAIRLMHSMRLRSIH